MIGVLEGKRGEQTLGNDIGKENEQIAQQNKQQKTKEQRKEEEEEEKD